MSVAFAASPSSKRASASRMKSLSDEFGLSPFFGLVAMSGPNQSAREHITIAPFKEILAWRDPIPISHPFHVIETEPCIGIHNVLGQKHARLATKVRAFEYLNLGERRDFRDL